MDWERIARAEAQPVRLAILELMTTGPPKGDPGWSAKTIAAALAMPLATVSHHVRALVRSGLLQQVGARQRRGAIQRFYVVAR